MAYQPVNLGSAPNAGDGDTLRAGGTKIDANFVELYAGAGGSGSAKAIPAGRLTLVSGTPVLNSDQTAQSTVYYTPYVGTDIPIYSGSAWANKTFAELTLSLDTTNHLVDRLYDVFVWNNGGTISIGAGPSWSYGATVTITNAAPALIAWTAHGLNEGDPVVFTTTGSLPTGLTAGTTYYAHPTTANAFNVSTSRANLYTATYVGTSSAGSGTHTATAPARARGTGAGTTELQMFNGIWTNKNSITLTNGAGAGTSGIAANTATYVGTIYCTANGQTGMAMKPVAATGGNANVLGVFNAYNRVRTIAVSRDATATWTYATSTWRPVNNNLNNRISFIDGLAQVMVDAGHLQHSNGSGASAMCGVTFDSTSAAPGISAQNSTPATTTLIPLNTRESFVPSLGLHYAQGMECATTGITSTFFGAASSPTRQFQALTVELAM